MKIKRIVKIGLLFAISIIFSYIESMVPLPLPVPGVKFGLANIIVMYALFFLKPRDALLLVLLKAFFVFITRGFAAGILSFCGGVMSFAILFILLFKKEKLSIMFFGIIGAVTHNIGQFIAIYFLYRIWLLPYLPILIAAGIAAGIITSILLRTLLPILHKLHLDK